MTKTSLDPRHPRVLCECCGFPTRYVPFDTDHNEKVAWAEPACPLCEWENGPVDATGEELPSNAATGAERNGGHSLAEAQANFARFLSMYDPAQPEPWMPEPPSEEEVRWKEELVRQYKLILDPYNVDVGGTLEKILGLEHALSEAARVRAEEAEVPVEEPNDEAEGAEPQGDTTSE